MKFKLILLACLLMGSVACTERICPTYTQIDLEAPEGEQACVSAKP